ncbi:Transcriptional regulator, LuxR family [Novosphingobium resinovorum]|uniref:Transcriptional regulator, LuxR family n=2 Tax=Novosphingobium resinovorum TaxID=158500 RepID=A0A031K5W2_9SPHN|nr:helix-turn-helix transcriptional regulator [Novosphingobium lentum]EZP83997.1 Transcriptional regulator, LuxR family [Novosphingobium resinovorum]
MNDSRSPHFGDAERWARLTEKQRACLDLLLERKSSKQIARILGIAKPTVDQRIATARAVLGAADRDEAALRYARLKTVYDPVIHDPARIPLPTRLVPSHFPNGDPAETIALKDGAFITEGPSASQPPFGDLWRPDHSLSKRVMMMAAMLVMAVILILAGLAIGRELTRLISG